MSLPPRGIDPKGSLTASRRILAEWLAIAVLATVLLALAISSNLFRRADNLIYDRLLRLERQKPTDDIIVVAIDDESVHELGRFPWNRDVHARMLRRLAAASPSALIYDVLFVDPGTADKELTSAVASSRPILPLYMEMPGKNGEPVSIVLPLPGLRAAGARVGHANLAPDEDGVVRRVYLAEGTEKRLWPHLAALAACEAKHIACNLPKAQRETDYVRADPLLIPFAGPMQHFRTVPFAAVLDGSVPETFFKNRIVLVGATATGLSDTYATPMAAKGVLMSGVEVNANVVQALITGRSITPASLLVRLAFALIPLWLLLAGFLLARPRFNLFLGLGVGAFFILFSIAALLVGNFWISPLGALLGLVVVYPLWGWRRLNATSLYMHEELDRFRRDPDVLFSDSAGALDPVQSDIELLRSAIGRARDQQHFVTDILKGLPDASLVLGPEGKVRMLNKRARELLGKVEGQHFSSALAPLTANVRVGPPGPDATPDELKDASVRIFNVRWSPVRGRSGELVAWVLRLADITELQTATRQREEALQLLTHDMRSPQTGILASLNQGKDEIAAPLAKRIENYARRTLALADGFVQLARAQAKPLAFEELNIADIILDGVDDLWPQSSEREIHIETSGCKDEVLVWGDRMLLTRAVINLVGNAIKYTPPSSTIRCTLVCKAKDVTFSVCDEGPGLSEEQIGALFQPFHQAGEGSADGAGLGLAFVRSVAARHRGSVSCRSKPGNGACFELCLPTAQSGQRAGEGG